MPGSVISCRRPRATREWIDLDPPGEGELVWIALRLVI
jgi:hypothetical protein